MLIRPRVGKPELLSMQKESVTFKKHIPRSIEKVPDHGMANRGHMNSQLMGSGLLKGKISEVR